MENEFWSWLFCGENFELHWIRQNEGPFILASRPHSKPCARVVDFCFFFRVKKRQNNPVYCPIGEKLTWSNTKQSRITGQNMNRGPSLMCCLSRSVEQCREGAFSKTFSLQLGFICT